MTSATEVYNSLFAGKRLAINLPDRATYESLRVQLSRLHQTPKLLLELTDDSLCASFDSTQGVGTFWLGKPRRSKHSTSFTIVGESDA